MSDLCEFRVIDGRLACETCSRPLRRSIRTPPLRVCREPLPFAAERAAGVPCVSLGELVEADREVIGCRDRLYRIDHFACDHPQREAAECYVAKIGSSDARSCRNCRKYVPAAE